MLDFLGDRGEDDQPYAFNNRGEIAFRVAFSDLTQAIVVSRLLVVPEPTAPILAGIALTMFGPIKWRGRAQSKRLGSVLLSNG